MNLSTECAICLEPFKNNRVKTHTTECNHKFHMKCFDKIRSDSCPCCRGHVVLSPVPLAKQIKQDARKRIEKMKVEYNQAKAIQKERIKLHSINIAMTRVDLIRQQKRLVDRLSIPESTTVMPETIAQDVRRLTDSCADIASQMLVDVSVSNDYLRLSNQFISQLKQNLDAEIASL